MRSVSNILTPHPALYEFLELTMTPERQDSLYHPSFHKEVTMRPPDHMLSKGTPDSRLSVLLKIQMYPLSMHIYGAGGRCKHGSLRKQTNKKLRWGSTFFAQVAPKFQ